MKQVLQNLKSGVTKAVDVPDPSPTGGVLLRTTRSLISAGTERMLVEFAQGGYLTKARSQPEKVKQVLAKIKTDGLRTTAEAVLKRLDEPLPLGYCNVGRVAECSKAVNKGGFAPGERVVSNGPHAEIVSVPHHLCARIPDDVSDEDATFTVLGAIGLQGIRLASPSLGEKFVVYGTGLIGLLVVQLLKANGCEVLAVDLNDDRLDLAKSWGAQTCHTASSDPVAAARAWSDGNGVDGVIIAASAKSDEIVHQSAAMCRQRGRIVLVGVVGLNLQRADFYGKELSFQVSCSYGPGRYDDNYELNGHDYPIGFVRWTEQRNFQAVLGAMASGKLEVSSLITDRYPLFEAEKAYAKITADPSALGIILEYPDTIEANPTICIGSAPSNTASLCVAAIIGAGNFAKMTLGPALAKTDARLKYIAARTNGAAAAHIAEKYGVENATTDLEHILGDLEVNTVFITTRHNSHAELVCKALKTGKHTFVEKPLALDCDELVSILEAYVKSKQSSPFGPQLMLGFNRRFSTHIKKIKELVAGRSEPLAMHFSCNAGIIPSNVWVHDPEVGGGRIIGEACHFIDLLAYVADSPVVTVSAAQMESESTIGEDKMAIVLAFGDGSIGTVNYFGNGTRTYPKETMEVYSEGRILRLDNFRKLLGHGFKGFRRYKTRNMDKGHLAEMRAFVGLINNGGRSHMTLDEIVNASLASFAAVTAARESRTIHIASEYRDVGNCLAQLKN